MPIAWLAASSLQTSQSFTSTASFARYLFFFSSLMLKLFTKSISRLTDRQCQSQNLSQVSHRQGQRQFMEWTETTDKHFVKFLPSFTVEAEMATAAARGQNFAAIFSPASFQFSSSSVSSPLLQVAHFFGLARFPMSELRTFWFYQISHNPRLHFSPSIHPPARKMTLQTVAGVVSTLLYNLISKSILWQLVWENREIST